MIQYLRGILPAHAHRHERHGEIVVCQMNSIHDLRVYFIISRLFPGIRSWHRYPDLSGLVARVSQSLISPPFLIKSNTLQWKEYLIRMCKCNNDFYKCNIKVMFIHHELTPRLPLCFSREGDQGGEFVLYRISCILPYLTYFCHNKPENDAK